MIEIQEKKIYFQAINTNPKEKEDEESSYSYMRIGNKTYYEFQQKKKKIIRRKRPKTKDKGEDR